MQQASEARHLSEMGRPAAEADLHLLHHTPTTLSEKVGHVLVECLLEVRGQREIN
jgi:hypothetical protein